MGGGGIAFDEGNFRDHKRRVPATAQSIALEQIDRKSDDVRGVAVI